MRSFRAARLVFASILVLASAASSRAALAMNPIVITTTPTAEHVADLTAGGARAYFISEADGNPNIHLWSTDGTQAATTLLATIAPKEDGGVVTFSLITATPSGAYFIANDGALSFADAAGAAPIAVLDAPPSPYASGVGLLPNGVQLLLFQDANSDGGYSLVRTDGTAGGTSTIVVGAANNIHAAGGVLGTYAYFEETVAGVSALHRTGGTTESAFFTPPAGMISAITVCAGHVYFTVDTTTATALYATDGTATPTLLFGAADFQALAFTCGGSYLFFQGFAQASGAEPWISDGTAAGTHLLLDVNPGAASSLIGEVGIAGGTRLYFAADDGTHGVEPWATDGTAANTALLGDLEAGSGASDPIWIGAANGDVLFAAILGTSTGFYEANGTTLTDRTAPFASIDAVPSGDFEAVAIGAKLVYPTSAFDGLVVYDTTNTITLDAGVPELDAATAGDAARAEAVDANAGDARTGAANVSAPAPGSSSGCGCRVGSRETSRSAGFLTTTLALLVAGMRRSRRRRA